MTNNKLSFAHRKALGERVKRLRQLRGWSQEELGKRVWPNSKADTLQPPIYQIEKGIRDTWHDDLVALAKAFAVPIIELLSDAKSISVATTLPIMTWNGMEAMKKSARKLSIFWPSPISENAFVLPVTNDDAKPFLKGQHLVVDPDLKMKHGDFVVASNGDLQPVVCEVSYKNKKFYFNRLDGVGKPFLHDKKQTRLFGVIITHVIPLR